MLSYAKNGNIYIHLKKMINLYADGEVFHTDMSFVTQSLGLQGHKRWNRMEANEDRNNRIKLQHYILDMFGEIIKPDWQYNSPSISSIKEYLEQYLSWEVNVYKTSSEIINILVSEGYIMEADMIKDNLKGVRKEIEKVRRWHKEFESVNYDLDYIYSMDKILHDKVKEIEEN